MPPSERTTKALRKMITHPVFLEPESVGFVIQVVRFSPGSARSPRRAPASASPVKNSSTAGPNHAGASWAKRRRIASPSAARSGRVAPTARGRGGFDLAWTSGRCRRRLSPIGESSLLWPSSRSISSRRSCVISVFGVLDSAVAASRSAARRRSAASPSFDQALAEQDAARGAFGGTSNHMSA